MQRKPAPRQSFDKSLGLLGTATFILAALAVIPLIVIVLYAVAYMPFGVALLLIVGSLTRRRWMPGLRRRVHRFLSVPEITPVLRERAEPLHPAPAPVPVIATSKSPSGASADLRNAR
ncbi:MAG: hypothetical protein IH868_04125 [Chloroflexi bacterium]|nr:hypothetical protein [Chloroflexota bacterium]